MTGMNRLSPLIVRRPGPPLPGPWKRSAHRRALPNGAAFAMAVAEPFEGAEPAQWLQDLRLFATGWVGGLIFFGTLLG